jgi:acetylornithine/succinyldiaminopimelate/putrescine aminotransferase
MKSTPAERRHFAREDPPAIEVSRTDGSTVIDADGKRYLDFTMGWCVGNLGWHNAALERKAAAFRGPDYVYPGYGYAPWGELAELLVSLAPGKLAKCFRATGGSEAVDLAMQAAMIHTGRPAFLSLEDSYHGNTLAVMSIAASEYRDTIPNLLPHCHKIKPPLDDDALERIERRLAKGDVAAFVMEPISINLGVLIPDESFMKKLQRLCRRHGTLLVMDEVATGFGRTGTIFASEQFAIEPDIMTVAKALSGGVSGIGAMLATREVAESMEKEGNFYSTYGWHPRSTHVAIATLRYITAHRTRLLRNVKRVSELLQLRLATMAFDEGSTIHARGLAIGVDVNDEEYAGRIKTRCQRKGLLITKEGSTLLLLPALTIDEEDAIRGMDVLERCV